MSIRSTSSERKGDRSFTVVCGGTFDLFHKGHREFIETAISSSRKVIIGVTGDSFYPSKTRIIEAFTKRKKSVEGYLRKKKFPASVVKIENIYGPTLTKKFNVDGIVVTSDSKEGALLINRERKKIGLRALKIIEVPLMTADDGYELSSSRIRRGEIDRDGNTYINEETEEADYLLPDNLRIALSKPFGTLINGFGRVKDKNLVTVGDVTTKRALGEGLLPKLSIVDLKVKRKKRYNNISELGFADKTKPIELNNPAGSITGKLIKHIKESFKRKIKVVVQVLGEEDLAVIPAILAAPLGCEIYYGQPDRGIVRIVVSESKKLEIKLLISKFERKVL